MALLVELTTKLALRHDLTPQEVALAASALAATAESDAVKGAFLTALAQKGESPAEIAAFARAFRAWAVDPGTGAWADRAIDIVGTGGDHSGGFNISSLVVLVLACAGVPVMKHGNRGITSKCGSADLLAGLGVDIMASAEKMPRALEQLGYVFFFAPNYHPAFKHIAPVRRALASQGQRTVFNILGPLINPGRPAHILLGVFSQPLVEKLASTLDELGQPAGVVGHGIINEREGIDELTTATDNVVRGVGRLHVLRGVWRSAEFGLPVASFTDLRGGDVNANLAIVEAVLAGNGPAGLVDTIVFNAAVALHVSGRTATIAEGLVPAREILLGGAVRAKIAATKEFYRT